MEGNEEYIGGSARTFEESFRKHLQATSPIYDHFNTTGHTTKLENFSIVGRGGPKPHEADERINIHKGQQSIPEQKYRQIPSASHMG